MSTSTNGRMPADEKSFEDVPPNCFEYLERLSKQIAELQSEVASLYHSRERVVLFIDRTNLDQGFRNLNTGERLDYLRLRDFLVGYRFLKQARVYYSEVKESSTMSDQDRHAWRNRQDFYYLLQRNGFFLRCVGKRVFDTPRIENGQRVAETTRIEKGLDAALILDMERICRSGQCDTVILVSGDGDYSEIVSTVQKDYGVRAEVAFFRIQSSADLMRQATYFTDLQNHIGDFRRIDLPPYNCYKSPEPRMVGLAGARLPE